MKHSILGIPVKVNEHLFLKNPDSSDLGRRIVTEGLKMIREIGLEAFTFRKLATEIGTTESSIYRYFESKHKLLLYLFFWFWTWMEYQVLYKTNNIKDPNIQLELALEFVIKPEFPDEFHYEINLSFLEEVIISESTKAYLTKNVIQDNLVGSFSAYKRFCHLLGSYIVAINPNYPYPNTIIATIIEGIHHQKFFALHLPSLSDTGLDNQELKKCFLEMIQSKVSQHKTKPE
jgi:AcrR family transcriptional regulator